MRLLIVLVLLVVGQVAHAEEYERAAKYAASAEMEADVYEYEAMTLYSVPDDRVQYYVTKPNHPAYPYMVQNKILGRDLDTRFQATGYGKEVDREAAQKFLKDIDDANAEKMAKLKLLKAKQGSE